MASKQHQHVAEDTEQRPRGLTPKLAIRRQRLECLFQKPDLIQVPASLLMESADERAIVVCSALGEVSSNDDSDVH